MTSLTALDGLALKGRIAAYIVVVFSQQVTDHAVIKKRDMNYNTQYSALSMTKCAPGISSMLLYAHTHALHNHPLPFN